MARSRASDSRYWRRFALLSISGAVDFFNFFIAGYLVTVIIPQWNLTYGEPSVMLQGGGLGAICSALLWGLLSDALGRKTMLVAGSFVCAIASGSLALVRDGDWVPTRQQPAIAPPWFIVNRSETGVQHQYAGERHWGFPQIGSRYRASHPHSRKAGGNPASCYQPAARRRYRSPNVLRFRLLAVLSNGPTALATCGSPRNNWAVSLGPLIVGPLHAARLRTVKAARIIVFIGVLHLLSDGMSGFDGRVVGFTGLDENAASQHLTYASDAGTGGALDTISGDPSRRTFPVSPSR